MNRIYRAISLLLLSIIFVNCQKELNFIGNPDPNPVAPENVVPEPITAILQGNIYDENNQPADGVTVTVGSKSVVTSTNGYFRIITASLDKRTSLVTAQKTGYFKGLRVFPATSGTNQVVIKLIKKTLAGTVNATTGGSATLSNGSVITLPANGIVNEATGAAYTGNVNVYAAYIDPSNSDIATRIPGSFAGTDKNGGRVLLTSYGMMAVQLESTTGEKLQIKSGLTASLITPIPTAALSSAPATISLWSVNEQTGLWIEDGNATKQGNTYVGDVKHFSFWNCDVSSQSIRISMTIKDGAGRPIVHAPVSITRSGTGWQTVGWGWTDSLGQVGGIVPPNENLLVEVLDPCFNVVYSQNVAPLTLTTDLDIITVTGSTVKVVTLRGKLLDCASAGVANGYAIITTSNIVRYAATDANGNFEVVFITCTGTPSSVQIIGVDQTSQQQSSLTTVTVTAPLTTIPNITACGTLSVQFINYTIDGTNYVINSTNNDSLSAFYTSQGTTSHFLSIYGNQNPPGINSISFIEINTNTTGTFPLNNFNVQNYNVDSLIQPFNVTITNFANTAGEFFEGSVSGQFTADSLPTVHTITSTFKVRKNN